MEVLAKSTEEAKWPHLNLLLTGAMLLLAALALLTFLNWPEPYEAPTWYSPYGDNLPRYPNASKEVVRDASPVLYNLSYEANAQAQDILTFYAEQLVKRGWEVGDDAGIPLYDVYEAPEQVSPQYRLTVQVTEASSTQNASQAQVYLELLQLPDR